MTTLPPKIIFWGGTGQAKVNREIVEYYGSKVIAVIDDTPGLESPFSDVPIYEGYRAFQDWIKHRNRSEIGFSITIGNPHGAVRRGLQSMLTEEGLKPVTLVHPTAWVAKNAKIGLGTQIMAHAVISVEAKVGEACIINTGAVVDHEDILEDGVEIAPGATLCGEVYIGRDSWICTGATVLPKIRIEQNVIVGAGAVVREDIHEGIVVVGIPAKPLHKDH